MLNEGVRTHIQHSAFRGEGRRGREFRIFGGRSFGVEKRIAHPLSLFPKLWPLKLWPLKLWPLKLWPLKLWPPAPLFRRLIFRFNGRTGSALLVEAISPISSSSVFIRVHPWFNPSSSLPETLKLRPPLPLHSCKLVSFVVKNLFFNQSLRTSLFRLNGRTPDFLSSHCRRRWHGNALD